MCISPINFNFKNSQVHKDITKSVHSYADGLRAAQLPDSEIKELLAHHGCALIKNSKKNTPTVIGFLSGIGTGLKLMGK